MGPTDLILEDLSDRLRKNGFDISKGIKTEPYPLDLLAARNNSGISKGRMSSFIAVTRMDPVTQENLLDYSARATRYITDSGSAFLTGRLGNRLLAIPTVVSQSLRADLQD